MTEVDLAVGTILEILVYVIMGLEQSLIILMLIIKRKTVALTFTSIQKTFTKWSLIRQVDPCKSYNRNVQVIYFIMVSFIIVLIAFLIGPVLTLFFNEDNLPLDHHSHWIFYWPKASKNILSKQFILEMNNY